MLRPSWRRWVGLAWAAAAVLLAAAGAWRAARLPQERQEWRRVEVGRVAVAARWEWDVLYEKGNAVWPPGTVRPPGRVHYPLAGQPRLRATPVVEVEGPGGSEAEVRVAAVLLAALGDSVVWERPAAAAQGHLLSGPGRFRGQALQLDMAGLWREWQAVNRALELLEKYDGRVELVLAVRLPGLGQEVRLAVPVALAPDTFLPAPAERWQRQETFPVTEERLVPVPVPAYERALAQWPWLAGAGVCGALAGALLRRPRAPGEADPWRYRQWITRGDLGGVAGARVVEIEDLRSLVQVAHDLGRRVVHDPKVGYAVPDGEVCYLYRPGGAPRIGELLVQQGVVTEDDVAAARRQQAAWRRPLGECLVAMGLADEVAVYAALAFQRRRVYVEPGPEAEPVACPRLPILAVALGRRPDGKLAVAAADPAVPPEMVEAALGRPVWLALCRERALAGAARRPPAMGGTATAGAGIQSVGRAGARILRGHGVTLGLLLHACGAVDEEEAWETDDRRLYRQLLARGDVDPDLLQLAMVLARSARGGELPGVADLLYRAQRVPDPALIWGLEDAQLVDWRYVTEETLARARRLLEAAERLQGWRGGVI